MPAVTIRALADSASRVVREVEETGRPAIITNHGRPVAAIIPFNVEALEDYELATAPQFVAAIIEASDDLAKGRTQSMAEVFLDEDQPPAH